MYSCIVGPTYQGTIVIEKIVCHSQFAREAGALPHAWPHWEAPGLVRWQKE